MKRNILIATTAVLTVSGLGLLFFDKIKNLQAKGFAKKFLGLEEIPGNMGFYTPKFDRLMREVGFRDGYQWCMLFAKMIWYNVYKKDKQLIDSLISPSTQQTWKNFQDPNNTAGRFKFDFSPKVGDIVIWQSKSNPQHGHAGIVTRVKKGVFYTIEGNTNDDGSRNGYKVALKKIDKPRGGLILKGFLRRI